VERSWKNEGATDGKICRLRADVKCLTKPKPLQPVATSRSQRHMVRRGSTVRVRQRALQKRRKSRFPVQFRPAPSRTCGGYGAVYGAFAHARGLEGLRRPPVAGGAAQENRAEIPGHLTSFLGRLLRVGGFVCFSSPGRCIVQSAASLHDHVDGVVGRPHPDHVAVWVCDSTSCRSA
jgi:hypothetical protein